MFEKLLRNVVMVVLLISAGVIGVSCGVTSKRRTSAKLLPEVVRKECDDSLVIKYNAVIARYRARLKNPKGMLVNTSDIRASQEDADSLRYWYSLMTDTQQYNVWPWPNQKGKFVPSPHSVFEDEDGRVRSAIGWFEDGQDKQYAYKYLVVLDGAVVDRNIARLAFFNADKASAVEFARLVGMRVENLRRVELVERDEAVKTWGYKGCNGAILITTKGLEDPIITVNGLVVSVDLPARFDVDKMTIEDYGALLGLYPSEINSINIVRRPNIVNDRGSGKKGVIIDISASRMCRNLR